MIDDTHNGTRQSWVASANGILSERRSQSAQSARL